MSPSVGSICTTRLLTWYRSLMADRDAYNSTYSARATSDADPMILALKLEAIRYRIAWSKIQFEPCSQMNLSSIWAIFEMHSSSLHFAWSLFTSTCERVWDMMRYTSPCRLYSINNFAHFFFFLGWSCPCEGCWWAVNSWEAWNIRTFVHSTYPLDKYNRKVEFTTTSCYQRLGAIRRTLEGHFEFQLPQNVPYYSRFSSSLQSIPCQFRDHCNSLFSKIFIYNCSPNGELLAHSATLHVLKEIKSIDYWSIL